MVVIPALASVGQFHDKPHQPFHLGAEGVALGLGFITSNLEADSGSFPFICLWHHITPFSLIPGPHRSSGTCGTLCYCHLSECGGAQLPRLWCMGFARRNRVVVRLYQGR